jgi:hypothetical protein
MKFKLFGIMWNVKTIFGFIWVFTGVTIICLTFVLPKMSWPVIVVYFIAAFVFLATAKSVTEKLTGD